MGGLVLAPIVAYQRLISPAPAAALQVRADLLGVRGPCHQDYGICGGCAGGVAAAALQSVQPRRLDPVDAQRLFRRRDPSR